MTSLSLTCSPGLRNPGFSQTYTSNLTFFFFCCYGKERQQDSGSDPDPDPEDGSGPCRSLVSYPGPSIHNQEQSGLEEIFQQGQCLQEALMVHIDPSDISRRSQAPHPPPHPTHRADVALVSVDLMVAPSSLQEGGQLEILSLPGR